MSGLCVACWGKGGEVNKTFWNVAFERPWRRLVCVSGRYLRHVLKKKSVCGLNWLAVASSGGFLKCSMTLETSYKHWITWALGTAVAQWLRCCATNGKVAGSIPTDVSGFFIDIKSFRSHYGPGVDSSSNRNEYQEHFLGVKAAGA